MQHKNISVLIHLGFPYQSPTIFKPTSNTTIHVLPVAYFTHYYAHYLSSFNRTARKITSHLRLESACWLLYAYYTTCMQACMLHVVHACRHLTRRACRHAFYMSCMHADILHVVHACRRLTRRACRYACYTSCMQACVLHVVHECRHLTRRACRYARKTSCMQVHINDTCGSTALTTCSRHPTGCYCKHVFTMLQAREWRTWGFRAPTRCSRRATRSLCMAAQRATSSSKAARILDTNTFKHSSIQAFSFGNGRFWPEAWIQRYILRLIPGDTHTPPEDTHTHTHLYALLTSNCAVTCSVTQPSSL